MKNKKKQIKISQQDLTELPGEIFNPNELNEIKKIMKKLEQNNKSKKGGADN